MKNDRAYGLLNIIGETPSVKLDAVFPKETYGFELYAKMEMLNPGGSAKDRSAYAIMRHARELGERLKKITRDCPVL